MQLSVLSTFLLLASAKFLATGPPAAPILNRITNVNELDADESRKPFIQSVGLGDISARLISDQSVSNSSFAQGDDGSHWTTNPNFGHLVC
jgi:hypothetical protein